MLQDTSNSNKPKQFILPFELIDSEIDTLLQIGNLTRYTNPFFTAARSQAEISISDAILMSVNWREITKEFLFSVISSIGLMSKYVSKFDNPPYQLLGVLQNSMGIISDDLSNVFDSLHGTAPDGPNGAHYKWWEITIHEKLIKAAQENHLACDTSLMPGVINLLNTMQELSAHRLGAAVQLRVVEAIALEIAISFRAILSPLKINDKFIFPKNDDLAWINAHIKAEVEHHKSVKSSLFGMANAAITPDEQQIFLDLTKKYIKAWYTALLEFSSLILHNENYNLYRLALAKNLNLVDDRSIIYKKWICMVCDFIYDEEIGIPHEGIEPGTKFENIPDSWSCSDCGVSKIDFKLIIA